MSKISDKIRTIEYKNHKKKIIGCFLVLILFSIGAWGAKKPMPIGTDFASKTFIAKSEDVKFLYDLSYLDNGNITHEQRIFDQIIKRIREAKSYVLIDMFLFNDLMNNDVVAHRPLSQELTNALIEKKKNDPSIKIDFISDPINTVYGGITSKELDNLKSNGVNVIVSDLQPLRDSNPIYSSVWQGLFKWFGNNEAKGNLKNPFGDNGKRVTLRSYLSMLNFKANHRKVFIADSGNTMHTIITSANPHDGSSAHSNVALEIKGDFWQGVWLSESAVANMSDGNLQSPSISKQEKNGLDGDFNISLELVTESRIKESLLSSIRNTSSEDEINMAVFYLSDRDIVKSLIEASKRGTEVKIVMDPNKDAFGYKKIGIPNRQVASELIKKSDNKIEIRWYDTHGEQFHSKLAYIAHKNGPTRIILGSANFTRRNLDNYNLESNVSLVAPSSTVVIQNVKSYFERIWNNQNGSHYTVNYDSYKDDSIFKYLIYRIQEGMGLSSF